LSHVPRHIDAFLTYYIEDSWLRNNGHFGSPIVDNEEMDTYLLALIVLLPSEPPGGYNDLLEELLDGQSQVYIRNKWRRFYTDNQTILGVMSGNGPAFLSQSFLHLTPEAAREIIYTVAEYARRWPSDSWKLFDWTFTVGGVSGRALECWTEKRYETSPILICPECKETYHLGNDAWLISPEIVDEELIKRGNFVVHTREPNAKYFQKDVIYTNIGSGNEIPGQFTRSLTTILLDLQAEKSRRWSCKNNHVHGYPGSFFRHSFTFTAK
jgi:hypothetical protein